MRFLFKPCRFQQKILTEDKVKSHLHGLALPDFSYFDNKIDNGYPHDGRADKNPYPHDRRADKDSYPHDSNNLCIILGLQLSFAMINVQLMLV